MNNADRLLKEAAPMLAELDPVEAEKFEKDHGVGSTDHFHYDFSQGRITIEGGGLLT